MHKFASLLLLCVLLSVHPAVHGQFGLSGSSDSSSQYPRIKLAGPLGQLIGGQGISLNSGLGQVLSSIINTAANAAGSGSNSNGASGGSPLQQLATAASSNYINAIRALPFGQFVGGGSSQSQQQPQQVQGHSQFGNGPHGLYGGMQNPINFLTPDSNLFGGQHGGYDGGNHGHNQQHGHFAPNGFPHFSAENYFGGQFGQQYNHHHGGPQSSSPMGSSALYGNGGSYSGHVSGHHSLDK